MKRVGLLSLVVTLIVACTLPAAEAGSKRKRPSGIKGTVVNSTCYGPCVYPQPASPAYTGNGLTVEVRRASNGVLVATRQPTDGHFRVKVKRGLYDVTASVGEAVPTPTPQAGSVVMPCWQGETKRVQVRRHRFTQVELHVQNVCIV